MSDGDEIIPSDDQGSTLSLVELLDSKKIITDSDMQALELSKQFIAETYLTVPMYRPLAVKLFGVLDDAHFPTSDMKFWQCKVEAEVHAMELVRELHDFELQRNQIKRADYTLKKIKDKHSLENDEDLKMQISFDIREQELIISKKKFELFQMEKKIKYRIEEVNEWRQIAQKLTEHKDFKNQNYAQMLADSLLNKWTHKINSSTTSLAEKNVLNGQIRALQEITNSKNRIKTQ